MRHDKKGTGTERLATFELFQGLHERDLREVRRLSTRVEPAAGFELTRQGRIGQECFLVLEGTADVVLDGELVAEVGPGEWVGEMALVDHRARSATVIARTPMAVLVFNPRELSTLRGSVPVLAQRIDAIVQRRQGALGAAVPG